MNAPQTSGYHGSGSIVIMARAPLIGRCKTRLIPALGRPGAARLHRQLVRQTLELCRNSGLRAELWCTPSSRHGFFHSCRRDWGVSLRRQVAGDLGRKMAGAIKAGLGAGAGRVLVLGTDCPALTPAQLLSAFEALGHADTVLQPAEDGGYVLLGSRQPLHAALRGIRWSSGQEAVQTLTRIRRRGLHCKVLPVLWDLDHPADLRRARRARLV